MVERMADYGNNFVQLHNHTHYSLLDGASKIPDLAKRAAELGMPAVGITDHGNMHGAYEMYTNCVANGVKPIIGIEAYVTPETARQDKSRVHWGTEAQRRDDVSGGGLITHLTMWAENDEGLVNLIKASSVANLEGRVMRYPRMDKEVLATYSKGVIASSGCPSGIIQTRLRLGQFDEALRAAGEFQDIFGKDNFFIELMDHGLPIETQVTGDLLTIAKKLNAPLLATNDSHYVHAEDAQAQDAMLCINSGSRLDDPDRFKFDGTGYYIKTAEEMRELFKDHPDACDNTLVIAERCNVMFDDHEDGAFMPKFPCPEGWDETSLFLKKVEEGLEKRYDGNPPLDVLKQADYECGVICQMQFCGYFLVVADYIQWAKDHGIMVGPGRGSAAGAMVAYSMGITELDPLKHGLIFERFLNPERVSLPDIDVDFDDDGRGRVLNWVTEKYGQEKVAHIITYGTMATKLAIKDVARVQKLPLSESDRLCKLVPDKIPDKKLNLPNAIAYVPELQAAEVSSDPVLRDTIKYAKMLEGNVRNTGVHACGTIICRDDITDWVPVSTADDKETGEKMLVTQYEGSVIEDTGLIKMDFLGLKTLSIIKEAVANVRLHRGLELDIDKISISDPATYKLYCDGRTIGTFQFESAGMQKYLRELQPSTFEDLIAMNALYRPGPMDYIPDFIDRKWGRKPIEYDIPIMEKYLKDTYGITVYQEQVMLLSRLLADFTRGESDALRKAMGKKLRDKLDHMKPKFISGGQKNGHDPKVLEKIWADWEKFASYAFNKSHATCYSWVAYQTAFLKANYPAEYMAAVMSRSLANITDITKLMDECKAMGINTLGPDVNESNLKFTVNKEGNIRFGLGAVKGVGEGAVQSIMEEREKNGPFKGIFDFVQRVNLTACNKKNLECLALAGGFDSFPELKREQYFAVNSKNEVFLETLVRYGNRYQADQAAAANSLFGGENVVDIATPEIPVAERWSDLDRLNRERDLVGIYLSAHPLDEYSVVLEHVCNTHMAELEDKTALVGREITMGGIVTAVRRGISKNGNPYGIAKIEDYSGSAELPFFGNDWVTYQGYLGERTFLFIKARCQPKQWRQDELELKITSMELLPDVKEKLIEKITILIPLSVLNKALITELAELTKERPGSTELYFKVRDEDSKMTVDLISRPVKLSVGRELIAYLKERPDLEFRIN